MSVSYNGQAAYVFHFNSSGNGELGKGHGKETAPEGYHPSGNPTTSHPYRRSRGGTTRSKDEIRRTGSEGPALHPGVWSPSPPSAESTVIVNSDPPGYTRSPVESISSISTIRRLLAQTADYLHPSGPVPS
ncbi:hypothetical protein N7510_010930 [Penicillium lagena]|uniref:uncharacterized protein n=1 Tax=Penicillium lagena TaxID=94218 RepID=UPI0025420468|nr:uncharacterized protein N7510_010930 [Penicillium lagena]KAJ5601396.1 hypothetical protein N7510_010930 [Penicillium lagena]